MPISTHGTTGAKVSFSPVLFRLATTSTLFPTQEMLKIAAIVLYEQYDRLIKRQNNEYSKLSCNHIP